MKRGSGSTGIQTNSKKALPRPASPAGKPKRKNDTTSPSPSLQHHQEPSLKPKKKKAKKDELAPKSTSPQPQPQNTLKQSNNSLSSPPLSVSLPKLSIPSTITLHQAHPTKGTMNKSVPNLPQVRETRSVLDDQNECFKMDMQLSTYSQSAQKAKFWNDSKHWGADHLNVFGITFQKCQHSLWDDSDVYLDSEGEEATRNLTPLDENYPELAELYDKKITQKHILDGSAALDTQLTRGTRNFLSLLRSAAICSTATVASSQAAVFSLLEILSFPCFPFSLSLRVKKFLPVECSLVTTESDIVVGRIAGQAESSLEALPLIAFVQETGSAGGKGCLAACLLACAWDTATRFGKKDPVLWGGVIRGARVQMFKAMFPSSFLSELEKGEMSIIPRVHIQELPSFDLLLWDQRYLFMKLLIKIKNGSSI